VGIAVVGVAALKMAGGVEGLSSLVNARAAAESASAPSKAEKPAPATSAAPPPVQPPGALPGLPPQVETTAATGPAVCAPTASELAKQAGLSPGELQVIQTLGARRGQLDAREQALDTQLQLIAAAERKVDARIQAMNALKADIEGLVGQVDAHQQAEIDRLVSVYEKMKPKDAGPLMAALDDKVRLPVAAKMKPAALAAILAQMSTTQAKVLSESLAKRFTPAQSLAQALEAKPAPPPVAAAPAAAPATPRKTAARKAPAPARRPAAVKAAPATPRIEAAAVAASGATAGAATSAAKTAPPAPAAKADS
jgi:flagellar motility protein MotE (MotC chaperone)